VTFEPNPRNLKWLKRNIALNQINIELVEAAVSISEGTEWFDAGISHGGHLLSGPEVGPADNKSPEAAPANASAPASRYEVRVVNFLDFFESRKVSKPLLKIDIEGEEMRLIPPLIRVLPRKCAIFFETHAGQPAWDTISTMLSDNGFSVTKRSSWEYLTMGLAVRSET
jgi:FkbM family methyltransferase